MSCPIIPMVIAILFSSPAGARELAGVTLADSVQVGGQTLQLNGMGLREYFFIDIYVGGLYLPEFTRLPEAAIHDDVPKRMVMHFIYKQVSREQMIDTFREGMENNPETSVMGDRVQRLYAVMEDVRAGDEVVIDYLPGEGTSISIRGVLKETIPGADFMEAVWTLFIGPKPPSQKLKKGLLGG